MVAKGPICVSYVCLALSWGPLRINSRLLDCGTPCSFMCGRARQGPPAHLLVYPGLGAPVLSARVPQPHACAERMCKVRVCPPPHAHLGVSEECGLAPPEASAAAEPAAGCGPPPHLTQLQPPGAHTGPTPPGAHVGHNPQGRRVAKLGPRSRVCAPTSCPIFTAGLAPTLPRGLPHTRAGFDQCMRRYLAAQSVVQVSRAVGAPVCAVPGAETGAAVQSLPRVAARHKGCRSACQLSSLLGPTHACGALWCSLCFRAQQSRCACRPHHQGWPRPCGPSLLSPIIRADPLVPPSRLPPLPAPPPAGYCPCTHPSLLMAAPPPHGFHPRSPSCSSP